ncbi:MAG: hypothetical protein Q9188_002735, partial [Gyalolechia gomerana]
HYASYYKAQATNPLFTPSVLSNFIPLTAAQAQENSYFAALMTATSGTVPLPPYITALPLDQQSYVQAFHAHVTSIASVDYGRSALVENNTASQNGTANNNESVTTGPAINNSTRPTPPLQEPTTTPPPPLVPAPSLSAGNATNTTDSEGAGSPNLSTGGVHRMAAGALAGMLGVAMFL